MCARRLLLLVAAVLLFSAHASAAFGAPSITASPTENLSPLGTTAVVVGGSGFIPTATVQVQQCATQPGSGTCVGIASLTVGATGTFSTSVLVSYDLRGFSPPY